MAHRMLPNQSHFDMFDFFQSRMQSVQLQQFIHLLSHQFNSSSPFASLQQFHSIFKELEVFKFDSQSSGLACLVCALQGRGFIKDRKQRDSKHFDQQAKKEVQGLEDMVANFSFNRVGNPVSDIKNNLLKIVEKQKEVEEYVLNCNDIKDSRELFNEVIINHQSSDGKRNSIRKLSIRSMNQQGITSLKQAKLQHKVGNKKRYFYCYFFSEFPQKGNCFWIVCLQAHHKAKSIEAKPLEDFVAEQQEPEIHEILDGFQKQSKDQNKNKTEQEIEIDIQIQSQNQNEIQIEKTTQKEIENEKKNQDQSFDQIQNQIENESEHYNQNQNQKENQNQNEQKDQDEKEKEKENINENEKETQTEKDKNNKSQTENKIESQNHFDLENERENESESENQKENENENQIENKYDGESEEQKQIFIDEKCQSEVKDEQTQQLKMIEADTAKELILEAPQIVVKQNSKDKTWKFRKLTIDVELMAWILVIISLVLVSRYVN